MLFSADILRRSNDRIYLKNRKNLRSKAMGEVLAPPCLQSDVRNDRLRSPSASAHPHSPPNVLNAKMVIALAGHKG
jgi:hypothetical protein